ncbi:hypothetical protein [Streptomyces sp. NPDC058045]|uniref:hypothetical protein n=1 Tax=Streptomyces sp. NPDC058045 TaxID=3346311 RepID=UPI0036ECD0F6
MKTAFEDRLLAELKQEVVRVAEDRQPVARGRRLFTPVRVGVGLVTAAAAVGAVVALPGPGDAPAYAVEKTDDGIVISLDEWDPQNEAEFREFVDKLREVGAAVVYNPPENYQCQPSPEGDGDDRPPQGAGADFVGGATPIAPDGGDRAKGGGEKGAPAIGSGKSGKAAELGEPFPIEKFTVHIKRGDTVILSDLDELGYIAFVQGPCAPVPDGAAAE